MSVSPDAESVERLFEFRLGLEMESARLAAQRHTDEHLDRMSAAIDWIDKVPDPIDWQQFNESDDRFHLAIAEASLNPYLRVAIETAREMQRDVVDMLAAFPGSIRAAARHHRSILAAISDRNTAAAMRAMAIHIEYTADAVQADISLDHPGAE
jgi:DNA-binding GntR family transcriptional regulator